MRHMRHASFTWDMTHSYETWLIYTWQYVSYDSMHNVIWFYMLPAPMNHVKIFKGWPLRDAPSEVVQPKYFLTTMMVGWKWKIQLDWVINPVPHSLVRRIRFWRIRSPEQDFEYLYWTISQILLWNLCTSKGAYMIVWVGRNIIRVIWFHVSYANMYHMAICVIRFHVSICVSWFHVSCDNVSRMILI